MTNNRTQYKEQNLIAFKIYIWITSIQKKKNWSRWINFLFIIIFIFHMYVTLWTITYIRNHLSIRSNPSSNKAKEEIVFG